MANKITSVNMALNYLCKQMDEMYHNYSMFCGLSDPALSVLYAIFEDEDAVFTQNDMVTMWCYPKQTVNYTVGTLVKKGWLTLEQLPGARNSKALRLTEAGRDMCREKILPLMQAEERAIMRMSAEEREALLRLMTRQSNFFAEEINSVMQQNSQNTTIKDNITEE